MSDSASVHDEERPVPSAGGTPAWPASPPAASSRCTARRTAPVERPRGRVVEDRLAEVVAAAADGVEQRHRRCRPAPSACRPGHRRRCGRCRRWSAPRSSMQVRRPSRTSPGSRADPLDGHRTDAAGVGVRDRHRRPGVGEVLDVVAGWPTGWAAWLYVGDSAPAKVTCTRSCDRAAERLVGRHRDRERAGPGLADRDPAVDRGRRRDGDARRRRRHLDADPGRRAVTPVGHRHRDRRRSRPARGRRRRRGDRRHRRARRHRERLRRRAGVAQHPVGHDDAVPGVAVRPRPRDVDRGAGQRVAHLGGSMPGLPDSTSAGDRRGVRRGGRRAEERLEARHRGDRRRPPR